MASELDVSELPLEGIPGSEKNCDHLFPKDNTWKKMLSPRGSSRQFMAVCTQNRPQNIHASTELEQERSASDIRVCCTQWQKTKQFNPGDTISAANCTWWVTLQKWIWVKRFGTQNSLDGSCPNNGSTMQYKNVNPLVAAGF